MKNINVLTAVIILICVGLTSFNAMALTNDEQRQRDELEKLIRKNKNVTEVEIDPEDESVNFKYNNILYWITIENVDIDKFHFTLHQQSIRIANANDNPRYIETEPAYALYAANQMTLKNSYQAAFNGDKITIQYNYYGKNSSDFYKILEVIIKEMQNSMNDFKDYVKAAPAFFANNGTDEKVVPFFHPRDVESILKDKELDLNYLNEMMQSEEFQNLLEEGFEIVKKYYGTLLDYRINK